MASYDPGVQRLFRPYNGWVVRLSPPEIQRFVKKRDRAVQYCYVQSYIARVYGALRLQEEGILSSVS